MPDLDKKLAAIEAVLQSGRVDAALRSKTNAEIADLLLNHVWATLPIFSPQSDLIDEAMERLNVHANMIRPETDEDERDE